MSLYSTRRGSEISSAIWIILQLDGLLVAKTVLLAAVGALPGDTVAGHAPQVLVHAILADAEAAAAPPAEHERLPAALALLRGFAAPSFPAGWLWCVGHGTVSQFTLAFMVSNALYSAVLSFKGIHANSAPSFQQPPSKSGQNLDQPESGVKRTENTVCGSRFLVHGSWFVEDSGFKTGIHFWER